MEEFKITKQARENLEIMYDAICEAYENKNEVPPTFDIVSNYFLRNLVINEILECMEIDE